MDIARANLRVKVNLGKSYTLGKVAIVCPSGTERRKDRCVDLSSGAPMRIVVSDAAIKDAFALDERCLIFGVLCYGTPRFTREQWQRSKDRLKKRFQDAGYPGVRVIASDPRLTVQRSNKVVDVVVTIDPRRRIDVAFEGYDRDAINIDQLRKQLTFNLAGSADEVEIGESARALTTYIQTRGFFDAHVTWTRERIDTEPRPNTNDSGVHFDRIVFKISMGARRRVARVEFVGNTAIPDTRLRELVQTKESNVGGRLFGTVLAATSAELIVDQDRIKEAYARIGYPAVKVWPSASPAPTGLDSAALTAALLGLDAGGDLYVRFTIEEGQPTLLSRIVVTGENAAPIEDSLCAEILGELATRFANRDIAARAPGTECSARILDLKYRADEFATTRDQLRDYLLRSGRGRAMVAYEATQIGPHRMQAHYTVSRTERLKLGKVVIRGNFKTRQSVIYDVLDFDEGQLLTTDRLAQGARRLRNTGLFESVNIEMPELDCDDVQRTCNSDVINAVVRVEERYDHKLEVGLEAGYSTQNEAFFTARLANRNIGGAGIALAASGTYGQRLTEAELRGTIPKWLSGWVPVVPEFTTIITGLHRNQVTDRFGRLTTQGISSEFSYIDSKPRTDDHAASVFSVGPYYAFRRTSRNIDALRPIGADMDEAQVAVRSTTGAVGVRVGIEQRVDRNGQLAPLAPEAGQHLQFVAQFASPYLLGQDTFLKFSASGSKFIPIGDTVVLRGDLRYDHGVPLGGAVLLPEVERFFAGGDSTVRGYSNERLATELIQVGLPPLDNVTQIRVIPAGGNIRALGTLDLQARIWRILAGALFTDAGLITNQWSTVEVNRKWGFVPDIPQLRPSVAGLRPVLPRGSPLPVTTRGHLAGPQAVARPKRSALRARASAASTSASPSRSSAASAAAADISAASRAAAWAAPAASSSRAAPVSAPSADSSARASSPARRRESSRLRPAD
jgi:outer membrane protein assembly factor BamA